MGRGPFYRLDEALVDLKERVPGIWPLYAAKMIEYREWGRVFFSSAGTPIVSLSDEGRAAADEAGENGEDSRGRDGFFVHRQRCHVPGNTSTDMSHGSMRGRTMSNEG